MSETEQPQIDTAAVCAALEEIGKLLILLGENPFKTRAYENGARTLEQQSRSVRDLVEAGDLGDLKGFGDALVQKVTTLVETGSMPYLEELRAKVPDGLSEVLRVPGLGPKKVRKLWQELGVESLAELEYACRENRLVLLKGFGEKSQAKALEGIRFLKASRGRSLLADVLEVGEQLAAATRELGTVSQAELAGSIRRRSPVIKDVDVVVATEDAEATSQALAKLDGVQEVVMRGPARTSVVWEGGLQVDWRIVEPAKFASALLHFTGSKEHNVLLRQRAKDKGWKLSEYGLEGEGAPEAVTEEAELYEALGLRFIPPEMREGLGELEVAAGAEIVGLIERDQVRGALHMHTTRSDGAASLRQMAEAARDLGFDYLGVTDHSKTAVYASGLTTDELREQAEEIRALNEEDLGIRILHGVESDILPDGSLDYPDEVLAELDFVIGSVHSSMQQPEAEMTARVLKAMDNPYLDIVGHPTGRILLGRKGFAIDMEAVIEKAASTGVILELNASPSRLDLDYRLIPRVREAGVKVAIDPDAHSTGGLADVTWGVHAARKGGCRTTDVINTLPLDDFLGALRRNR